MNNIHRSASTSAVGCEPMSRPQSLVEKTEIIKKRLIDVLSNAETIHGELYGHTPSCQEDGNEPIDSLDQTLSEINHLARRLEDCLSETLLRLRG